MWWEHLKYNLMKIKDYNEKEKNSIYSFINSCDTLKKKRKKKQLLTPFLP